MLQVPQAHRFSIFWSINPIKPMWASDLPMFLYALKPKDVRVPLPVQLILDCHWLVCVWGEGPTIGQLCLFFLFSSIESWQMPSRPLTGLRERCPLQGTVYTRCWDWRKGPQQRTLKEPTGTLNTVTLTCSYSIFFRNSDKEYFKPVFIKILTTFTSAAIILPIIALCATIIAL